MVESVKGQSPEESKAILREAKKLFVVGEMSAEEFAVIAWDLVAKQAETIYGLEVDKNPIRMMREPWGIEFLFDQQV